MGHTFYSIHLHNTSNTYMHCQYAVGRTRCAIIVSYCVYYYKNCVYSTESHTKRSNQTGPDRSHCNSVCCRILNYVNDFSKRNECFFSSSFSSTHSNGLCCCCGHWLVRCRRRCRIESIANYHRISQCK